MAYVPKDAKWYLAELVQEIRVEDDPRNVVWRNLTLIRADSPDEAYDKALRFGHDGDTEYDNPEAKQVKIAFRGISRLDVIYDDLEDGAELLFYSQLNVSQKQIAELLCSKERLSVFQPIQPMEGPDVASAEIIDEVEKRFGITRPIRDT